MVICLELDADLHTAQLMPLPITVSCFSKIQIGFTFLVPVCVCVCVCVFRVWWGSPEQSGSSAHNHSTTLVPGRAAAAPGSATPELDSTHMNGLIDDNKRCVVPTAQSMVHMLRVWWGI